ncbi:MAG: phosphoglycerate kinase [Eggerthellaceae bacterium]|nr:phosphoglycerate kinase [Eggerthellaceae bacterium]
MADIKTLDQADVNGKRVLLRVDFNVPLRGKNVLDDTRIRACIPTIEHLISQNARIIILSHLGRPSGEGYQKEFSLGPAAKRLAEIIGRPVQMATDVVGPDAQARSEALGDGEVLMLENLRFDAREKLNDRSFVQELASLGDLFVNDAFGAAHRDHASISGIPSLLPSYAGLLLQKEVQTLSGMLDDPRRPFVAILGGSKVSDKVAIINSLIDRCDTLIIGGGMCFTFLLAQGKPVGNSLKELEWIGRAALMLEHAEQAGVKIMLPVDVVAADRFSPDAATVTVDVDSIPEDMMGMDIGPETSELFAKAIADAGTVFWNGPMGVFEMDAFAAGTQEIAEAVAANKDADTIIGGGDSVSAVNKYGLADQMSFISTGGGASMKLVEGSPMPGVEALKKG